MILNKIYSVIFLVIASIHASCIAQARQSPGNGKTTLMQSTQEKLERLQEQLKACQAKKSMLLQQCDSHGCLKNIHTLQSQLDLLEQRASVAPLKKKMGTIICRMTQQNDTNNHHMMCSTLQSLDSDMQQFRIKNHKNIAAIERRIAELTQKLLNNMPDTTKQELKNLLAEYSRLQTKMDELGVPRQNQTRQPQILELLFI